MKKKALRVERILTEQYGRFEIEVYDDPLDTLIETILSQNTTDRNSHRAFELLKRAYPSWEGLEGEDPDKVASIIKSGGLAAIKARRILGVLDFIRAERGELDLGFLGKMDKAQADAWLARMKGVGPKTRSIVLLFSFGMPTFPVDTHIHRVTKRLGLIGFKVSREQAQEELAKLVPKKDFFNFHIGLIEHGRAVCKARNPRCEICALSGVCDFYEYRARKAQT